jgi:hypothetical protein
LKVLGKSDKKAQRKMRPVKAEKGIVKTTPGNTVQFAARLKVALAESGPRDRDISLTAYRQML